MSPTTKRSLAIAAAGALLLVLSYVALPLAFAQWLMPEEWHAAYTDYVEKSHASTDLAPVQLWSEWTPEAGDRWRVKRAQRLTVVRGQAFIEDAFLARERIAEFLDAKVARGDIDYVVVSAAEGTTWGEIVPIVAECRRARVQLVLLNNHAP